MELLEQKIFFKLSKPLGNEPVEKETDEYKIWRNKQKVAINWSREENRFSFKDLENEPNVGMAIPQGYILIDIDDYLQASKIHKVLVEKGLKFINSHTGKGQHFIFKDPKGKERDLQSNGLMSIIGIKIDSRIPAYGDKKGGYVAVKFLPDADIIGKKDGNRFVKMYPLDQLDELPFWLEPIKQQYSDEAKRVVSDEWSEGNRDNNIRSWTTILWNSDINEREKLNEVLSIINEYLMSKPLLRANQLVLKVNKWVEYAESIKPDEVKKNKSKIVQNSEYKKFNLMISQNDIDYKGLCDDLIEKFKIVFYDGTWWMKRELPWHEKTNEEEIMDKFVGSGDNLALKVDERRFFLMMRNRSRREVNNDKKHLINFKNGVLNIKDNSLSPYNEEDFSIFGIETDYKETEPNQVDAALEEWTQNNQEIIDTLMEFVGSIFYPDNNWTRGLIIYGKSADNGKSTFMRMMTNLIKNEYITSMNFAALESRFGAYDLIGKKLVQIAELEDAYVDKSTVFKQIVGSNDAIEVEGKNIKNKIRITPTVKFIGATNKFPKFADQTNGLWRRLIVIPFDFQPTQEQRLNFDEKKLMSEEAKERLVWLAIEGLKRYLRNRTFTIPKISKEIQEELKLQSNVILSWILEEHVDCPKIGGTLQENFGFFKDWCLSNAYKVKGRNTFKKEVVESGKGLIWEQIGKQAARLVRVKKDGEVRKKQEVKTKTNWSDERWEEMKF